MKRIQRIFRGYGRNKTQTIRRKSYQGRPPGTQNKRRVLPKELKGVEYENVSILLCNKQQQNKVRQNERQNCSRSGLQNPEKSLH